MKGTRLLLLLALGPGTGFAALTNRAPVSVEELRAAADRALAAGDSVENSRQVHHVWSYAQRLLELGRTNDARPYVEQALVIDPWNLPWQLTAAELAQACGEPARARERAATVAARAETDVLVDRARRLLGEPIVPPAGPLAETDFERHTLVLVPVGGVERVVLNELADALARELALPVRVQDAGIALPPATRDRQLRMKQQMMRQLQEDWADPERAPALRRVDLTEADFATPDQALEAVRKLALVQGGREARNQLDRALREARGLDPQWSADQLLEKVRQAVQARKHPRVLHLGVTAVDIYGDGSNFLFGLAGQTSGCGLISYSRFVAEAHGETPDRPRLITRLLKQSLSSLGFMIGVDRCSSPTCARSYPRNLSQHDAKSPKLCPACQTGFDQALIRAPSP